MASGPETGKKIPVFIGEGHYEVVDFLKKQIENKVLPETGNVIVKLDALPDTLIPKEMLNRTPYESEKCKDYLYSGIGMHEWLQRCAKDGHVDHVIWVKPPWSQVARDGAAVQKIETSSSEKEVTVDIVTLGKNIFQTGIDNFEEFFGIISQYISCRTRFVLDIDLSFFSSISPFNDLYEEADIYPLLEEIFKYPEPSDGMSLLELRDHQIGELKKVFKYLEEKRTVPADLTNPLIETLREKLLSKYTDDQIDYKHIFDAGCVCNSFILPVHLTEREKILEMQSDTFSKILANFSCSPSAITVARSTEYDCYVPIKDANFIEQNLVKVLKEKLNIDEPEMPYLDY